MIIQPKEIIPWAHQVFLVETTKPYYIDCTLKTCRICKIGKYHKNMQFIDDFIKEKWDKNER